MKFKKIIFMLKKLHKDINSPIKAYDIASNLHGSELDFYYFLFEEKRIASGKDQKLISNFDKNGIPINKTYVDVTDKDFVYFPISIGQMGLSVFHTFLKTQSENDKKRFLKFADWFMNNADHSQELGVRWLTDVCLPAYHNDGPWQSAFSQSRGISILLRAYQITDEKKYLSSAEKALIPFLFPVNQGGVTSFTEFGPFYEEYTSSIPTLVLNGMIFSLFGIYDFIRAVPGHKTALNIFNKGIDTLKKITPEFDLGFWTKYNLCNAPWYPKIDPSTIGYQRLHIAQYDVIYRITNDEFFKNYVEIFRKQDTKINALKMYKIKFNSLRKIGRL